MTGSYFGVQNFWHDFQEEFNCWITDDQSMQHTTGKIVNFAQGPYVTTTTVMPPDDYNHAIKFCEARLEKNDSFCNWCETLCDIHTIKPCQNNWGSFAKSCCGLCDFRCDAECPVLLYALTSLFCVIGRVL